ncbi:hypothetical protein ER57_06895 [Smithella sp. SCADC]|jgi:hypothetical protein|nr:hypothetical protein ER57_06895 [Smithella sp. SCADC]
MDAQISKDLQYVIAALPSFGTRYAHLVMGYAQLFGVTPMHLKAKKLRLIVEEMKKLFDAQSFAWQKKLYPISHAGIAEALDICIKKNFTDKLENHNYLKKVMIGISEREGKGKSKQAEKDLRERESNVLAGGGRPEKELDSRLRGNDNTEEKPERITPEQAKTNIQRVGEILKTIGG